MLGPIGAEVEIAPPMKSGACGTPAPVFLRRIGTTDKVDVRPPALLNCRMVAALSEWVEKTLQPAARESFGTRVTRLHGVSGYSCRNRYNNPNDKISQHAFANAVDITGFDFADGRAIDVVSQWGLTARDIRAQKLAAAQVNNQLNDAKPGDGKASDDSDHVNESHTPAKTDDKSNDGRPAPARLGASLPQSTGMKEERTAGKAEDPRRQRPRVKLAEKEKPEPTPSPKAVAPDTAKAAKTAASEALPADADKMTKEAAFLRRLHAGACKVFGTVLGPEANEAHRNHFHLDMTVRRKSAYCE
jgi:hypothetical protein